MQRNLDAGKADPYEPVLRRHLHLADRIVDELLALASYPDDSGASDALDSLAGLSQDAYVTERLLALA